MATTAEGVPLVDDGDAADLAASVNPIAVWLGAQPGIARLTYAAINALAGGALWTGRLVWQTNTGADRPMQGLYEFNGIAWRLPWNLAWGRIDRTPALGTQNDTDAAEHTINALDTTFVGVANRLYRIKVKGVWTSNTTTQQTLTLKIKNGATLIQEEKSVSLVSGSAGVSLACDHTVEVSLPAGTHTIHVTQQFTNAAGGQARGDLDTLVVTVDDIGPSGDPA